jgi:hypothetical protein
VERENHAENNPDHPVSAFPFGCVAQLAVQCTLGILSEWWIRITLDHCHHLDRLRHCISIIVVDITTPAPLSNSTFRYVSKLAQDFKLPRLLRDDRYVLSSAIPRLCARLSISQTPVHYLS